jgi:uncharacterized protein (TIGR00255 family)
MINSMTGFGQAQAQINGACYSVEVKTVNNRYLKTIIKLPELLAFLEDDIEKLLRKNLSRGTVNYVLRLKDLPTDALFDIDDKALQALIDRLSRLCGHTGFKGMLDVATLLNLPGMIKPALPDGDSAERFRQAVMEVTQMAIDRLKQMRATEGSFLEADLRGNYEAMGKDIEQINSRSAVVIQEYAKKLRQRVDVLLSEAKLDLDQTTLAREVAIFADRSDISEEVARLQSHVQQFAITCQAELQAGRRLDFISQEMLREANTIASKASDTEITRCVVDIKCRIERIKEQVQNIE